MTDQGRGNAGGHGSAGQGDRGDRDVHCWQRLSPWAMLILFVRELLRFIRQNIPVLIGAGAGVAYLERIGSQEVLQIGLLLMLTGALLCLWYYRRFRFRIHDGVLFVQKGLFERKELRVEAGRVQHMAIEQPAFMRPFGVVRFSVDTPGGIGTEVELPGIRRQVAEHLRRLLAQSPDQSPAQSPDQSPAQASDKDGAATGRQPADGTSTANGSAHLPARKAGGDAAPQPLFRLRARGLSLHGLASNYTYVLAMILAPLLQPLDRLLRHYLEEHDPGPWALAMLEAPVLTASGLIVLLILGLLMASVALSWLRFFGFELVREQGRFVQRSGLLNRQEQTLSVLKLQSVEWVQTAIARGLGRGYLVCRQYGGGAGGADHAGRNFLVPGLDHASAMSLSREFWPQLLPEAGLMFVHPYYRRVLAIRTGGVLCLLALMLAAMTGNAWWLAAAPVASLLAWPLIHQRWRMTGWRDMGYYALVRRGLIGQRTVMFPVEKVQAVAISRSWFQRRQGLATLRLTLASGPVTIPCIAHADALRMANRVLYRVESPAVTASMAS